MTRWLLGVLLFACGSPRPEPAPVTGSGSDAAQRPIDAAPVVVAIDADPFVGYPDRIARPSGCTLRGAWSEQPRELRLVADGKPFAEIFQVKQADVTLGDGVFAELATASIRIGGYLDKTKLRLHAAKAFVVGGYAVPGPRLAMRFVSEREGAIAFELPMPSFARTKALFGTQPCSDLAIDDKATFDPRDAIDADTQREAYLYAKRAIPLSIEPGKPAVVELRYEQTEKVDVLEKTDKLARVAVEINALDPASHVMVFGWVPASALHDRATGFGGSWATGGDRSARRGPPIKNTKLVSCAAETPLVVEFAGERRTVGVALPNAVIEVLPGGEDFAEVRFPRPTVELARGARWLVKQAALADCAAVAAP